MRSVWLGCAAIIALASACRSSATQEASTGVGQPPPPDTTTTDGGSHALVEDSGAPVDAADAHVPPDAPPPPKVDVTTETLQVFGEARSFVLVVPRSYAAAKSYPLVMVFHGDGGNGAGVRAGYPLDDHSGEDAIVVYPDSKGGFSWDLYTPEAQNPDNAFVAAIAADLATRYTIDLARVFGTGYSSGAFFVNQLACRKTGFFRAIVPHAGGAPYEPNDPSSTYWKGSYTKCANQTGGVAAMIVHGSDDTIVVPESGDFTAQYWAYVNGCDEAKETRAPTTPAPCTQHAACPAGMPVLHCSIPNIGHGLWSESAKQAWAFFASF